MFHEFTEMTGEKKTHRIDTNQIVRYTSENSVSMGCIIVEVKYTGGITDKFYLNQSEWEKFQQAMKR